MKCPHCNELLSTLVMMPVTGVVTEDSKWKCVIYGCPSCQKAISAQMDPLAVKADTILETVAAIKGEEPKIPTQGN